MAPFSRLIRFESDGATYFSDLGVDITEPPSPGSRVTAYLSLEDLVVEKNGATVVLGKLMAPLPYDGVPIYCVGMNYRSHAAEAKLLVPANPPLWTKPAAALAAPNEDIPMNKFCASSFPDFEGELVFVVARECRDISQGEAGSYILGYTAGNDISCRLYQMPEQTGGQFFYAKAFDKFAPMGPTLISPEIFGDGKGFKLVTRVNGKVVQEVEILKDMIFNAAKILSFMSQGTTIPAGTAVMTGTPAGVGAFQKPQRFLRDQDIVEVEVTKVGILRNKIAFAMNGSL
ncbi:fumarylacetoacetate hydrolase family protein [Bisporella sp. PMI_857]|nr:fumarylacetoacetate hydrolase family protein [Bisporella sp. PMI_857]